MPIPQFAAGHAPYPLVRSGDRLVFWGYDTYSLDLSNIESRPVRISHGSWFFAPSPQAGRVWVVWRDDRASTPTHYFFSTVREISTRGRVVKQGRAYGDWWLDGAIRAGPVFETRQGLAVWDPQHERVLGRIRGSATMAASFGNTVVWCKRCGALHFTNPLTGDDRTVGVPAGYETFYAGGGSFSPDGKLFAVPVGNGRSLDGRGAVALIDVRSHDIRRVPGSQQAVGVPWLAWDSTGTRLYMVMGRPPARLVYFDMGSFSTLGTGVAPPKRFFSMVAS